MRSKASKLRQLFKDSAIIKVMGAHDGLGAKLIEKHGFDGIWASGLEISTSHAVPDANILTMTENLQAAIMINDATELPVICDCDTGYGNASNVRHMVRKYEAAGIAAVVIEDKLFPKVNSFVPGRQELATIAEFAGKIEAAKNAQKNPDFMVFARIEALIAGWGMEEAVKRAQAYAKAGADGIVIHSKSATPDEIYEFIKKWNGSIPVVVIPTMFYKVTASEFGKHGIHMVIYANHGLRASIRAMEDTFQSIIQSGSTEHVEDKIATLKQVFELQGMTHLKDEEKKYLRKETVQAIIPAAGVHRIASDLDPLLKDKPVCMLDLGGKSLIERQMNTLRSCDVSDIIVVGGSKEDQILAEGATLLHNVDYQTTGVCSTLMTARQKIRSGVVMVYSDIVFDKNILERLIKSPHDITLVLDKAYRSLPKREKKLDLVYAEDGSTQHSGRKLGTDFFKPVKNIGRQKAPAQANYEFIGMVYCTEKGWKILSAAWDRACLDFKSKYFYEASSAQGADLNDLIQYLVELGQPVYGLEIEQGWSEIHSAKDVERVSRHFRDVSESVARG
jgi:phosphoenolpyruvate phosphomutase